MKGKSVICCAAAVFTASAFCSSAGFAETVPLLDFTGPSLSEEQRAFIYQEYHFGDPLTTADGLFTYSIRQDPHLCAIITEYHGEPGDIVIPDCAGGVRINQTAIDFSGRADITSVTHTGYPAFAYLNDSFRNCVNLESFTLNGGHSDALIQCYYPDGLPAELGDGKKVRQHYSLSDSKFEGCAKLETVSLPYTYGNPESPEYSSSYIGAACFKDCTALKEIELGGYVTVAEDAFLNCTALEKVMFDEYVRSIGAHALGYTKDAAGNYQLCAGLTICGTAGTAAEVYAEENGIPFVHIGRTGDIDDSGSVDVADAVLLARYLSEDREAVIGFAGMHQLDVNRDGGKDLNDVTQILRMIARYA